MNLFFAKILNISIESSVLKIYAFKAMNVVVLQAGTVFSKPHI